MKVLLLSRYDRLGASSRLRSYQYIPYLNSAGISITVSPLLDDYYLKSLYFGRVSLIHVLSGYLNRVRQLLGREKFDLVWVEKEVFPWLPAFFDKSLVPENTGLVVDYDDALFHRYDMHRNLLVRRFLGHKIDSLMARADLVVVGNEYLGCRALSAGSRRVEVIPTVVDLSRYSFDGGCGGENSLTIGWVGSPSTSGYLRDISQEFCGLQARYDVQLVAVGAREDQLMGTGFTAREWTEDTEVEEIRKFDIGIMPLPDLAWERGKCGYKLIQYMACGVPVVASPVGVNSSIVNVGVNGFLANTPSEWREKLACLLGDASLRKRMGLSGRNLVEEKYCLDKTAPRLAALLKSTVLL